jgi:hypothetical protein
MKFIESKKHFLSLEAIIYLLLTFIIELKAKFQLEVSEIIVVIISCPISQVKNGCISGASCIQVNVVFEVQLQRYSSLLRYLLV